MPRRIFDSELLFGLHDPGGEQHMLAAGRPGWVLFTEELGRDPNDFSGRDYQPYSSRNLGVISRLNHGYHPNGTLPPSSQYANFARRCANFVANSRGCKIWIIGNEMNHAIERPQVFMQASPPARMPQGEESGAGPTIQPFRPGKVIRDTAVGLTKSLLRTISGGMGSAALFVEPPPEPAPAASPVPLTTDADPLLHGAVSRFSALHADVQAVATPASAATNAEVITPELYARCYSLCRAAIHAIPGHADDQVLIGAVAPWNNQTIYAGNPNGDWVQYFVDILRLVGADSCDGIALHTYTHGSDPNLISDERRMDPPFQQRRYHFRTYQDFMRAIPSNMRHLPVYITETDQDDPWLDSNNGWVQRAYSEINAWNQQLGNQQIRALILYRWPNIDRWAIETKPGVINDFRQALTNNYRWRGQSLSTQSVKAQDMVETLDIVNLRRTPGFAGKTATDIVSQLPAGTRLNLLSSASRPLDQLLWWQVRTVGSNPAVEGWLAEAAPNGTLLLALVTRAPEEKPPPPPPVGKFRQGDQVVTRDLVRLRQTPGFANKALSDILAELPASRQGKILDGPRAADNLTWWQVATTTTAGAPITGWIAETAPNGDVLLEKASAAPPALGTFALGELGVTTTAVNVRRTPGFTNKAATDLLAAFEPRTTLNILAGPRRVDGLDWWRVGGITLSHGEVIGWVAERAPSGEALVTRAPKLPGTNIPNRTDNSYLHSPFQGSFGIFQLWGENPQIYGRITYEGVALKGHNGIDFLTPNDTNLLAVDEGTVQEVVPNDPSGLGNYIKLGHAWGESLYAHLRDFSVQPGQVVRRGQIIGRSDNTGFSSGPHLHFAIRLTPYNRRDGWGGYSDPLPYLHPKDVQLPAYVLDAPPASVIRPQASPTPHVERLPLAEAPGYAPDRAGVKRP